MTKRDKCFYWHKLDCAFSSFPSPDTYHFSNREYEYLAITYIPGFSDVAYYFNCFFDIFIIHELKFCFGKEINPVLARPV
jgi:hypothetical protein